MNFKRLMALAMAMVCSASLISCGKKEPDAGVPGSQSQEPVQSVIEPVEPVLPFVNPLTGEGCETDIGKNRPIAVMLNDHKRAMPQLGVSQADIIYELPAEGGITRMMALFQSLDGVGEIGTVRSARDYYVSLAYGHEAIFLHAGGSPQAYEKIKKLKLPALDCVNGPYEGTLYWRDQWRKKNRGMEHSVLTSGETITKLLPTYKKLTLTHRDDFSEPLRFMEPDERAQGAPASSLSVPFSSYKTGTFTYDPETRLYGISQYDAPYVDGNTNEQVSVKNVLVLYTDVSNVKGDDKGRKAVRTTGEGKGQFFCDGTVQDITWHKKKDGSPLFYTNASGEPLALGVGPTYVNVVGSGTQVTVCG